MERSRTKSENSRETEPPADNNPRKRYTRTVSSSGARNKSSSSESSTSSDVTVASGHRLSILDIDYSNRKASTGSNSEYKFDTQDDSKYKGMVKDHYINTKCRSHCQQCNRKFSVKFRPHHCRRCGGIHCMKCLRYRRKLNRLANFDPNGKPRKVCKRCFNEETESLGYTRRLTDEYCKERQLCKHERVLKQRAASLTTTFWRDQLDMPKECARLLDGFSATVGTSEAKKTLSEIQDLVKPPKWQKSSFWQVEKLAENCRVCKGGLGIRKKKRNCKVCGLALCKKCSNRELLLYIDSRDEQNQKLTKLAIIKVAGCPEKEPDVSLLLHVCTNCKEYIQSQQTNSIPSSDCLNSLINMDSQFSQLQDKLSLAISQCEQMIDSAELEERQQGFDFDNVSDYLTELSNDLDTYERLFHSLRNLGKTTETRMQKNLIKHYTTAKYEYYMENRHAYRRLRNRMRPAQNNKLVLAADVKPSGGGKINEKMVADKVKDSDNDRNQNQEGANIEDENVNNSSGGNATIKDSDNDAGVKVKKKTKQASIIKRKFTNNKTKLNAKKLESEEDKDNPSEKSYIKKTSNRSAGKNKLKSPINDSTNISGVIAALNSNGTDQDQSLENAVGKNEPSEANKETGNPRESGEVFLSEDTVSWKR